MRTLASLAHAGLASACGSEGPINSTAGCGPRNHHNLQREVARFWRPLRILGGPKHRRQIPFQLDPQSWLAEAGVLARAKAARPGSVSGRWRRRGREAPQKPPCGFLDAPGPAHRFWRVHVSAGYSWMTILLARATPSGFFSGAGQPRRRLHRPTAESRRRTGTCAAMLDGHHRPPTGTEVGARRSERTSDRHHRGTARKARRAPRRTSARHPRDRPRQVAER